MADHFNRRLRIMHIGIRPHPMATTIAVLSQKGGTGKTTLTRTLSDVFARLGL